jgi:NAD-dependent deacetylase
MRDVIEKAAGIIKSSSRTVACSGAGISVESGIPPFRGENGLWSTYNPVFLEIGYFRSHPLESWKLIKEIFYDYFGKARPNRAHEGLAELEKAGYLHAVITQNIDNLHQQAGSSEVYEFHGSSRELVCMKCGKVCLAGDMDLDDLPPRCPGCGDVLRPNFVFFGEPIPEPAQTRSIEEAQRADALLLIGTTGEIMPASAIPLLAKGKGAVILEINIEPSRYTDDITDIFIQGKASEMVDALVREVVK